MAKMNSVDLPIKANAKKVIGTSSISGPAAGTALTLLMSIPIPANTFVADEVLTVTAMVTKTQTTATASVFLYYNDTNNLTTPTLLGFFRATSGAAVTFPFQRRLAIDNASGAGFGTIIMQPTINAVNDMAPSPRGYGATAGGFLYSAINWTTAGFIVLAGAVANTNNTMRAVSLQISN